MCTTNVSIHINDFHEGLDEIRQKCSNKTGAESFDLTIMSETEKLYKNGYLCWFYVQSCFAPTREPSENKRKFCNIFQYLTYMWISSSRLVMSETLNWKSSNPNNNLIFHKAPASDTGNREKRISFRGKCANWGIDFIFNFLDEKLRRKVWKI